eukprot:Amastigsp_a1609_259.p2 type:complete len:165 gc:universal Amastigsp_a1609_259:746-252(-)
MSASPSQCAHVVMKRAVPTISSVCLVFPTSSDLTPESLRSLIDTGEANDSSPKYRLARMTPEYPSMSTSAQRTADARSPPDAVERPKIQTGIKNALSISASNHWPHCEARRSDLADGATNPSTNWSAGDSVGLSLLRPCHQRHTTPSRKSPKSTTSTSTAGQSS